MHIYLFKCYRWVQFKSIILIGNLIYHMMLNKGISNANFSYTSFILNFWLENRYLPGLKTYCSLFFLFVCLFTVSFSLCHYTFPRCMEKSTPQTHDLENVSHELIPNFPFSESLILKSQRACWSFWLSEIKKG